MARVGIKGGMKDMVWGIINNNEVKTVGGVQTVLNRDHEMFNDSLFRSVLFKGCPRNR